MATIEEKAQQLHDSLYRSRTKEEDIVKIIMGTTRADKESIRYYYDKAFPPTGLIGDIKKKLTGEFRDAVANIFLSRAEYDLEQLTLAIKKKDEQALYEIILTRPDHVIAEIKELYAKKNRDCVENEILKNFQKEISTSANYLLGNPRAVNHTPDKLTCNQRARSLMDEKPENWATNIETLKVLATSSPEELLLITRIYRQEKQRNILQIIEKLDKIHKTFLKSLFYNVLNPTELFARKLNDAVRGLGTDYALLDRIVLNRYDVDMDLIKKFYYSIYQITAKQDIAEDTSGAYQTLIAGLLNKCSDNDD